jgi:predicted Zn finger-like uncharacterized protein
MLIQKAACPTCHASFIVDQKLWDVGTVKLRCIGCGHRFLPPASPKSLSVEQATNAGMPIKVWQDRSGED